MKPRDRMILEKDGWHYFLDGQEVSESVYREAYPEPEAGCPAGPALTGWPIYSDSQLVHPKQIAEARALDQKLGVPTDYSSKGQPIYRDRMHRKAWLKAHKKIDRNSYSGY